jgi:hypothetical protein
MAVQVLGTTARAVTTLGAVAGVGYVAGPYAATTAARWGARAGVTQAATQRAFGDSGADSPVEGGGTKHDNVADDGGGNGGIPEYRRSENDPGYY